MIAVGIDIGKRQHEACFMDEAGHEIGPSLRFAHRRGGVRLLQERLDALPESATVALEASGHYWIGLERWLRKGGIPVQVVNPLQVHAFREAGIRRTKTDRRDAWVLADLLRIGRTRPNYVPNDTILQLRELTRFRWGLIDQIGGAKRRVLAVLDQVFPEFADHFSDPFGVSARELLAHGASAADFAAIDLDELTALLEHASRKRFGREKAESIARSAQESLGVPGLEPVARLMVRSLLAQIAHLELQVAEADAMAAELLAGVDQYLTSIPGVGPVLAATILAEIGDIDRFPRLTALVAYAGIDPSVFESGGFKGTRQHISKRGSPYLRRALYLATHSAQRQNTDLGDYLQRKLREGKSYKVALVATSHKLLARMYVVLKEGRPFEVQSGERRPHRKRREQSEALPSLLRNNQQG
jgi:transposase